MAVSEDGTWQKRGFKSIHRVATASSYRKALRIFFVECLSKNCLVCAGALRFKSENPALHDEITPNHDCESHCECSSGKLKFYLLKD